MISKAPDSPKVVVTRLGEHFKIGDRGRLAEALGRCPDVAFAYLAEVRVGATAEGSPVVFVWLRPGALKSLRGALNLVSETVARVIPESAFVDVVILNSAPELLSQAEEAEALLVEADSAERARAIKALDADPGGDIIPRAKPTRWWWPF